MKRGLFIITMSVLISSLFLPYTQSLNLVEGTKEKDGDAINLAGIWKFIVDLLDIGEGLGYQNPDFPDSTWDDVEVPDNWENQGYGGYDGIAWYRKKVDLPEFSKGVILIIGGVDDYCWIWVNGKFVGENKIWNEMIHIDITNSTVQGGVNTIAVKVQDIGGGGGIYKAPVMICDENYARRLLSPVEISGFPVWYAGIGGTVIGDYGSHWGIKCAANLNLGSTEEYGTFSWKTRNLGNISFSFKSSDKWLFRPCDSRSVSFTWFGWNETARSGEFEAELSNFFIETDVLLTWVKVRNAGKSVAVLSPAVVVEADDAAVSYDSSTSTMVIGSQGYWRAVAASFGYAEMSSNPRALVGKLLSLGPGEEREFYFVTTLSISASDASIMALKGLAAVKRNPSTMFQKVRGEWETFLSSLPPPHTDNENYRNLYYMAATALRMLLYEPRNAMQYWSAFPGKSYWSEFYCWDIGFQILGYSEWNPELAEECAMSIFSGQRDDGMVPQVVGDDGRTGSLSNPPVFGWTLPDVLERDANRERASGWIQKYYDAGKRWMKWWWNARDANADSLYEYRSCLESGWDNSPRGDVWGGGPLDTTNGGASSQGSTYPDITINFVDLNSYIYRYYLTLSNWAEVLGEKQEAQHWKKLADELASRIESRMWDEDAGCWYDTFSLKDAPQLQIMNAVNTPAIWWPAFMEVSKNTTRIKSVIEKHLLNPEEFWGKYPIPTVAYNERVYDPGGYWRGIIWLVTAYSAVKTLYMYGYENEAHELVVRLLDMMSMTIAEGRGGVYENYRPDTGRAVGCSQFGWSSAFTMEMLLERYQRTRYIMPGEKSFSGHVKVAKFIQDGGVLYVVETGEYGVPMVAVSSGNVPLESAGEFIVEVSDGYGATRHDSCNITIKIFTFAAKEGHRYQVSPASSKAVDLTPEQNAPERRGAPRFIPGFEISQLMVTALFATGLILLLRSRRNERGNKDE